MYAISWQQIYGKQEANAAERAAQAQVKAWQQTMSDQAQDAGEKLYWQKLAQQTEEILDQLEEQWEAPADAMEKLYPQMDTPPEKPQPPEGPLQPPEEPWPDI
jgi:hypothetical protein